VLRACLKQLVNMGTPPKKKTPRETVTGTSGLKNTLKQEQRKEGKRKQSGSSCKKWQEMMINTVLYQQDISIEMDVCVCVCSGRKNVCRV